MGFFKSFTDKLTKPKVTVSLKLNKYIFNLGDTLEGTLSVSSEEEVDATEIRAELRCEEKSKGQAGYYGVSSQGSSGQMTTWKSKERFKENPRGSGPIHLSAGYRGEFPFSTTITGGEPSLSSETRSINWTIKGVIGVKGRPDVTSSTSSIQVATTPNVITERIVEREVVMTPCQYCGSLFPQTVMDCPKCHAPRKE